MNQLFFGYLILMNIVGFATMGIDKKKAQKNEYRISEKTLWLVAFAGGALGSWLGMQQFRHKTKHRTFSMGLPFLVIVYGGLVIYTYYWQ
ncbi:DUF1294 domain-containing protein [Jeotgalibacillus sp. R-1-5s-1]|uniref:DUF1294 domain-containing protein n=1 Tax=Jeotgalibacillus sp. R-1-5s-1 TaxID=2555897 RepID=UPI0010690DEF|nr:DUF1294 domain-containing protein [Jeotgalibacillus sp. R-1-5s-1]TFD92472.1 DUF1294 domain-containing protein [Jeotgalibacillus sp. R-1-5s-1]